jgi:transcriptional regulator with XRE-family HTH domain
MSVPYLHPMIGAKTRRKMLNLTAGACAKALGVDANSYSRMERGERRITLDRALALSKLLQCTVEQLGIEPTIDEQTEAYKRNLLIQQRGETDDPWAELEDQSMRNFAPGTTAGTKIIEGLEQAVQHAQGNTGGSVVRVPRGDALDELPPDVAALIAEAEQEGEDE